MARADLAAAAATVAATPQEHRGRVYELVGTPITAANVAARLTIPHHTIGLNEYRSRLLATNGLLPFQLPMLVSIASAVRHGLLGGTSPDLARLLERTTIDALSIAVETAISLGHARSMREQ